MILRHTGPGLPGYIFIAVIRYISIIHGYSSAVFIDYFIYHIAAVILPVVVLIIKLNILLINRNSAGFNDFPILEIYKIGGSGYFKIVRSPVIVRNFLYF